MSLLCWPLLFFFLDFLGGTRFLWRAELAMASAALQVVFWVVLWVTMAAVLPSKPNPYVPKRLRSYISRWFQVGLTSVNTSIEALADSVAPLFSVRSTCRRAHLRSSAAPTHHPVTRRCHRAATLFVFTSVTMGVARAQAFCDHPSPPMAHRAVFDSDSYDILVDGGATACISNCLADFIRPPTKTPIRIKGFNGTYSTARIGTVRWPILDDNGVRHVLQIPDTYYVPVCPMRLLSPQHYSQQRNDFRGTYSTNFGDQVNFVFDQGRYQVTLPLNPSSNVGILRSSPDHQVFSCSVEDLPPKEPPPDFFAYPVLSDEDAANMELHEDTESVSSTDPAAFGGEFKTPIGRRLVQLNQRLPAPVLPTIIVRIYFRSIWTTTEPRPIWQMTMTLPLAWMQPPNSCGGIFALVTSLLPTSD